MLEEIMRYTDQPMPTSGAWPSGFQPTGSQLALRDSRGLRSNPFTSVALVHRDSGMSPTTYGLFRTGLCPITLQPTDTLLILFLGFSRPSETA